MEIRPVAHFHSPLTSKFGIPRQSGLVSQLAGSVVFEPDFRHEEAVRGLADFDYVWLIWEFSANRRSDDHADSLKLTARPPRLGGNQRLGVFATRSPFRPNPLGLSCVRLASVENDARLGPVLHVLGADLMDGTPIYDVKPYIAYADSHPEARSGFVDQSQWQELQVVFTADAEACLTPAELSALRGILAQDPRPRYHNDEARVYGMPFAGRDVRFRVENDVLTVLAAAPLPPSS